MNGRMWLLVFVGGWAMLQGIMAQTAESSGRLEEFKRQASRFKATVSLPHFETTTDEVKELVRKTMARGNAGLDAIAALESPKVTFRNTVGALDDIGYQIGLTANRLSLIKETSTNAALRDAATEAIKELQEWMVGLDYREDVYLVLKAYAGNETRLSRARTPSCCPRRCAITAAPGWTCPRPNATRWNACARNCRA